MKRIKLYKLKVIFENTVLSTGETFLGFQVQTFCCWAQLFFWALWYFCCGWFLPRMVPLLCVHLHIKRMQTLKLKRRPIHFHFYFRMYASFTLSSHWKWQLRMCTNGTCVFLEEPREESTSWFWIWTQRCKLCHFGWRVRQPSSWSHDPLQITMRVTYFSSLWLFAQMNSIHVGRWHQ